MNRNKSLTIEGVSNEGIANLEAIGLSKCFAAYANNAGSEYIECIGFNPNSGYVYIVLENGVQIVSCMGQSVEFLTTRWEDGSEYFYDTYEEALDSAFLEDEDLETEEIEEDTTSFS